METQTSKFLLMMTAQLRGEWSSQVFQFKDRACLWMQPEADSKLRSLLKTTCFKIRDFNLTRMIATMEYHFFLQDNQCELLGWLILWVLELTWSCYLFLDSFYLVHSKTWRLLGSLWLIWLLLFSHCVQSRFQERSVFWFLLVRKKVRKRQGCLRS